MQNTKDKVQNEENSRHSSQARNEREVESIQDNDSCTFVDKSTKIIQGTKTRYKPLSSEELDSSRSNSLSHKNLFLNVENTEQNVKFFGLRYEEMVLVDKEKLKVLVANTKSALDSSLAYNTISLALNKNSSNSTAYSAYMNKLEGIDYYNFISELSKDFDVNYDGLVKNLEEVSKTIFNKNNLTLFYL